MPDEIQRRARFLLDLNGEDELTCEEARELEELGRADDLLSLLKAKIQSTPAPRRIVTISTAQYDRVLERSDGCCEYCLVAADHRTIQLHVDHIISKKHGGEDRLDNLCSACRICNQYKGSDVAALRLNLERRIIERYEAWLRSQYPCIAPRSA